MCDRIDMKVVERICVVTVVFMFLGCCMCGRVNIKVVERICVVTVVFYVSGMLSVQSG